MTASCTLCGIPIEAPDDPIMDTRRLRRTVTLLAMRMLQHMQLVHSNIEQAVVNREENFPPGKPNSLMTLIEAASAHATLLTALSYLTSEDEQLKDQMLKMRELVDKAMEQKPVQPLVSA